MYQNTIMLFILKKDFDIQIPELQLDKLIGDNAIWEAEIPRTIETISSFLRARYDVSVLFAPFLLYADLTEYAINDRIFWTEPAFSDTETYLTDERVSYLGKLYKSKAGSGPGAWNPSEWDYLAEDESLYYCTSVSTGNLPTDTDFFTAGDNRNQDLLIRVIDIALYNIYSRLNNVDIPAIRKERFDGNDSRQTGGALGWLKMIVKGQLQPDFPLIEENQEDQTGNIVAYGYAKTATDKNTAF